jgi:hypothetical protein
MTATPRKDLWPEEFQHDQEQDYHTKQYNAMQFGEPERSASMTELAPTSTPFGRRTNNLDLDTDTSVSSDGGARMCTTILDTMCLSHIGFQAFFLKVTVLSH